jgi:hypothetical protein
MGWFLENPLIIRPGQASKNTKNHDAQSAFSRRPRALKLARMAGRTGYSGGARRLLSVSVLSYSTEVYFTHSIFSDKGFLLPGGDGIPT